MNNKDLKYTPEALYHSRRQFVQKSLACGVLAGSGIMPSPFAGISQASALTLTNERDATSYNNYYEFSRNKTAVRHLAKDFSMSPWTLRIDGLVDTPLSLSIDALPDSDEYVYRFRCVEGWSMVVPWLGFSLQNILTQAAPKKNARFVKFTSVLRPSEMLGQRRATFSWPYIEGLRLDEALHPLVLLATGMYQKPLPAQNGGPLRLVVPWKYGFKSIKAVERIELVAEQPVSSWSRLAPEEYGFYANVNPSIPHPRWSQRRELPLGETRKRATLPFNGYEKEVAQLYLGMDLAKNY